MRGSRDVAPVGRDAQRARLAAAAEAAAAGDSRAVLVSGEAGMGKTTLLRGVLTRADTATIGWGTARAGGGAPAFWPWTQVFDDLVAAVGADLAAAAAGRDLGMLVAVVRSLGAGDAAEVPDDDRVLLLDALRRWLAALAAERPVIVVLDDLQWADPSTLDLLEHVLAGRGAAGLLVLGAYRHDELDAARRSRLSSLAAHSDHIHLRGLDEDEVGELVTSIAGADVARDTAAALHRRTGGHPLFVAELARLAGDDTGRLPEVVTEAVGRRIRTLPDDTRELLEAAAVLGNRVLPDVVAHATGRTPAEVVTSMEPAVAADLLRADDGGLEFAHDIFRETIDAALAPSRRAHLHGVLADGLAARAARGSSVEPGEVVHHFAAAADPATVERSVEWARRAAGDERRRSAFLEAAALLRRARIATLDAGATIDPGRLVELLREEAEDLARAGRPDDARRLLRDAREMAPTAVASAEVALSLQRLGARFAAPRDEIISILEDALRSAEGTEPTYEARLTAALARELQHSVEADRRRAFPLSERALTLGRSGADDRSLVECLLARHDVLWGPGTGRERAELGREIATIADRLHDFDHHAEGLLLEANGLLEAGSPGFRDPLDRWFGLLETRDHPRDRYLVLTRRAALALLEGRADDAAALIAEAASVGDAINEPDTGNVMMSHRVALAQVLDDADEYRRLARDAVAHWTGSPVHAHSVAAGALAVAGDLDGAALEVGVVASSGGWRSEGSYLRSVFLPHLAEAAARLADVGLCAELLAEIEPLSGSCGVNGAVVAFAGPFDHTLGVLATATGDLGRAQASLRVSIETATALGAVSWAAAGRRAMTAAAGATRTDPGGAVAGLRRLEGVWELTWGDRSATVRHVKGMADLATLLQRPRQEVAALELANPAAPDSGAVDTVIDVRALAAYRDRLAEIDAEIDEAHERADTGTAAALDHEREELLAEIRRTTGLDGRPRVATNEPIERARKAVSARVRDAIKRIDTALPAMGTHLDRSVHTGSRCRYDPPAGEPPIDWTITSS